MKAMLGADLAAAATGEEEAEQPRRGGASWRILVVVVLLLLGRLGGEDDAEAGASNSGESDAGMLAGPRQRLASSRT